ncbi:MAG TPA: RecQ family ATP-dependent DNA helicase, partial [Bacteroidales bacterium]|nr:RecQ family ATP-dependent DNA helicase [Bacteroidales bacterium]
KNLAISDAKIFKSSFNRPNLYYEVRPKINPEKNLIHFIKQNQGKSGIIYCISRKKVEELAEKLQVNGIKAVPYHAGMDSFIRSRHQDMFLLEEVDVIVATIAFGMGIDKPDVRFVVHYDMPKSLEGYYQETGRAGRDGGEGLCIAYYKYDDILKLKKFLQGKPISEQEIGNQLISETIAFAESAVCRRKQLLHYFGEEYDKENCGNCDNCVHPKKQFEGKKYLLLAIKAVYDVKEKFKSEHVAKIIAGEMSTLIKQYKHNQLDIFAAGDDHDSRFWNDIIRQALINHLLEKDIINYGIIKITTEGHKFLKNPYSIKLYEFHNYDEYEEDDIIMQSGFGAVDTVLFNMLKDLRKETARKLKLPPFVIFQDISLEEMAIHYPITSEELQQISGVGQGKAMKYGDKFIDLIKKYVKDNEIERPQDIVVKSAVNKSGIKVFIIKAIDRKISLEEIAKTKDFDFLELLDEIESIIYSGTKLDIDYYLTEIMEPDKRDEIYEYFLQAETDSLDEAFEEFGDFYTEEEIRLVRIKFLSEMAN